MWRASGGSGGMELAACAASTESTGATVAATVFLSVFVILLASDAVLTAWALGRALDASSVEDSR